MTACEWLIQRMPENVLKVILTAASVWVVFLSTERRLAAEWKIDD